MTLSGKQIIDISFPLDPKTYKNNLSDALLRNFPNKASGFEIEPLIDRDSSFSVGQVARGIKMRLHSGSHIDAPEHWIEGGKQIHELPLELFVGDAVIADCRAAAQSKAITDQHLETAVGVDLNPGDRLIVKTGWNDGYFEMDVDAWKTGSPYMTPEALDWCIERHIAVVGIDFYHGSKAPGTGTDEMFESKLVRGGVLTLTNLFNLGAVTSKRVTLMALPLAIHGAEASPVRAVVIED